MRQPVLNNFSFSFTSLEVLRCTQNQFPVQPRWILFSLGICEVRHLAFLHRPSLFRISGDLAVITLYWLSSLAPACWTLYKLISIVFLPFPVWSRPERTCFLELRFVACGCVNSLLFVPCSSLKALRSYRLPVLPVHVNFECQTWNLSHTEYVFGCDKFRVR